MKSAMKVVLAAAILLSLSACAAVKGDPSEGARAKCPACGYEFNAPESPGN